MPFAALLPILSSALLLHASPSARAWAPALARPVGARCAAAAELGGLSVAELKRQLLQSAAEFKAAQEARWAAEAEPAKSALLGAESLANIRADSACEELRERTIDLIEALAAQNPTASPFAKWRATDADACPLDGMWTLQFTTGADATFRKTERTGSATTYQQIDAARGFFVNCVDFDSEDAKLRGFRVYVAGRPLSDTEVRLKFRAVKLLRRSRFLPTIVIPLPPSWLLRGIAKLASRGKAKLSDRGAGFEMLYLDADLRMHKTFDGQYFVQTRREA
jgi:hypothetical protein